MEAGWKKSYPGEYGSFGVFEMLFESKHETITGYHGQRSQNTKAAKNSNQQLIGDFFAQAWIHWIWKKTVISPLKPD